MVSWKKKKFINPTGLFARGNHYCSRCGGLLFVSFSVNFVVDVVVVVAERLATTPDFGVMCVMIAVSSCIAVGGAVVFVVAVLLFCSGYGFGVCLFSRSCVTVTAICLIMCMLLMILLVLIIICFVLLFLFVCCRCCCCYCCCCCCMPTPK